MKRFLTQSLVSVKTFPAISPQKKEYDKIVSQVQALIGFELCNQLLEQLAEYSRYEEYAYYAVDLGLRETIFRELCV